MSVWQVLFTLGFTLAFYAGYRAWLGGVIICVVLAGFVLPLAFMTSDVMTNTAAFVGGCMVLTLPFVLYGSITKEVKK